MFFMFRPSDTPRDGSQTCTTRTRAPFEPPTIEEMAPLHELTGTDYEIMPEHLNPVLYVASV